MDLFTECLIKRRKHFKEYAVIFPLITAGLIVTLFYLAYIAGSMLTSIGFALEVLMWWGIYIVISNKNIEFEYTITNKYIDIDSILGKRKRKKVANFTVSDVEIVAPADYRIEDTPAREIDASAHDTRYDVYYFIAEINGERTKILFNPSEKILDLLNRQIPKKVIIGDENE